MPILYKPHLNAQLCRDNPSCLVVFGDNLQGYGKGGQAIIRDEPNAVGIPTKVTPSRNELAYFTDEDIDRFIRGAAPAFTRLRAHLEVGGTVIWPSDGIGTGRAQLERRAPRIWMSLQRAIGRLIAIAGNFESVPAEDPREQIGITV